jgi:FdhD protein
MLIRQIKMDKKQSTILSVGSVNISRFFNNGSQETLVDSIAVESPLEIYVKYGAIDHRKIKKIAMIMRSPGDDLALAVGFLFTAGIIHRRDDILLVQKTTYFQKIQLVELAYQFNPIFPKEDRIFIVNAACGVCGAPNAEDLQGNIPYPSWGKPKIIKREIIFNLVNQTKELQPLFNKTGGSHAVCWFNNAGELRQVAEDIGRHNALDKVLGHALLQDDNIRMDGFLFFSGRAGFEMLQKSARAGINLVVAIGAPSSLAIEMAEENDITLVGFTNLRSFNVYSHTHRIQ